MTKVQTIPLLTESPVLHLCSEFDETCFEMTADQHDMCAHSLPMVCSQTGVLYPEVFDPKDGHCPFVGD